MWVITGTWRVPGPKLKPVPDKHMAKRTGVYPSEERSRGLLPGRSYKLGRSLDHMLACPFGHVSDHHATLIVGPHSAEDATDPSFQPTLTLQPLPAAPKATRDGERAIDKGHPVFLTTADGDEACIPPRDAPKDDTPRALGHGDVLRFKVDEAEYRLEWKPVVLKLEAANKTRAAIVEKAAPLGVKVVKKDSDVTGTHLVLDTDKALTDKALAKLPVLIALASQTPIVSPAFVDALTAAAEPLATSAEPREKREQWSALEDDVVRNWPKEAAFEPELDIVAARGSLGRDPARESLLKGLTVLGLSIKDSASVKAAREIVGRCGGIFVQVDLTKLPDHPRASLHKLLVDRKAAADKEYPAYLRQANKTIPSAARSSGLVLLMTSSTFTNDLAGTGLDLGWEDVAGASLGLELAPMKALGLALFECDPSPLLKASRRSGATGDGAQSLPSQVSASITSSRGQPEALVSPSVELSAPLTGASSPEKDLEDDTTFDLGDDDVGEISMFDLDAMESPPSSPPQPLPQVNESLPPSPPSRSSVPMNPFENLSVQIPPPTARRRRTAATESPSKAAGASAPASGQSSLGAGKSSYVDDSYEEPAPQSERAKSLYESIRAKSRGGGVPQASGSSSLAGGAIEEEGGDDDGEAFVEGQRKRRRAAQAEEEKRKRARLATDAMEGVEASGADTAGSQAGQSSREASALVDSAPAAAKGAMLPPPVPEKGKRKAVDQQDTDFLRAPVKRKRKNQAEDPLDVDFNNLKIAKLPGRRAATEEEVPEIDGVTPRLVSVFVPLFQKKPSTAPRAAADGVVDFKKFRSNKGGPQASAPRRRGPAVAMAPLDDGNSRSRAKRDSQVQEDEDMKPIADDDGSLVGRSASVSQRTTQSAGTSIAGGRRKKLIQADDSDDEPPVRSARGAKSAKKAAVAPNSDDEAARARTTATLEESDEEEAPAPRPKARTGRKKLIQAGDSDEDGFKGWGTNARAKRR